MDSKRQQVYGKRRRNNVQRFQFYEDFQSNSPIAAGVQAVEQRSIESITSKSVKEEEIELRELSTIVEKLATLDIGVPALSPANRKDKIPQKSRVLKIRDVNVQEPSDPEAKKYGKKKHKENKVKHDEVPLDLSTMAGKHEDPLAASLEQLTLSLPSKSPVVVAEASLPAKSNLVELVPTIPTPVKCPALPARSRRRQEIAEPQSLPIELLEYTKPLLSLCGDPSGSSAPTPFQAWSTSLAEYFQIIKIAEASYGEVYRLSLKKARPGLGKGDESVLKLIALKPPPALKPLASMTTAQKEKVSGMSELADVASEVRLLQRMSPVPGFTNFRDVRVMRGRLPTQFVSAWRYYHKNIKKSFFQDPGRKTTHDEDQLWAVVEMQDAGKDLETVPVESEEMCWDAFWGVTIALAKGEDWAEFEHRDLHLGNICVRWKPISFKSPSKESVIASKKLGFTGIETTIIDYTLSRALMSSSEQGFATVPDVPTSYPETAFFDLSKDPSIFQGDATEEYQYEIYRSMRSAVLMDDPSAPIPEPKKPLKSRSKRTTTRKVPEPPKEESQTQLWERHTPLTNLVWLHFILHEMTKQLPLNTKTTFAESTDETHECSESAIGLRSKLRILEDMLELRALRKEFRTVSSARQLVEWAVGEGWLDETDVVGLNAVPDDLEIAEEKKKANRSKRKKAGGLGKVVEVSKVSATDAS